LIVDRPLKSQAARAAHDVQWALLSADQQAKLERVTKVAQQTIANFARESALDPELLKHFDVLLAPPRELTPEDYPANIVRRSVSRKTGGSRGTEGRCFLEISR
jgi:hypothetical protein